MSTRCQIGFYVGSEKINKKSGLREPEVMLYRHCDGYPERVIPELLPLLKEFKQERGLNDIEYLSAFILSQMKSNHDQYSKYAGYGICGNKQFHGDIEYYYAVNVKDCTITVYEVSGDEKFEELTREKVNIV